MSLKIGFWSALGLFSCSAAWAAVCPIDLQSMGGTPVGVEWTDTLVLDGGPTTKLCEGSNLKILDKNEVKGELVRTIEVCTTAGSPKRIYAGSVTVIWDPNVLSLMTTSTRRGVLDTRNSGKAHSECQEGPVNAYGNTYHGCVLSYQAAPWNIGFGDYPDTSNGPLVGIAFNLKPGWKSRKARTTNVEIIQGGYQSHSAPGSPGVNAPYFPTCSTVKVALPDPVTPLKRFRGREQPKPKKARPGR